MLPKERGGGCVAAGRTADGPAARLRRRLPCRTTVAHVSPSAGYSPSTSWISSSSSEMWRLPCWRAGTADCSVRMAWPPVRGRPCSWEETCTEPCVQDVKIASDFADHPFPIEAWWNIVHRLAELLVSWRNKGLSLRMWFFRDSGHPIPWRPLGIMADWPLREGHRTGGNSCCDRGPLSNDARGVPPLSRGTGPDVRASGREMDGLVCVPPCVFIGTGGGVSAIRRCNSPWSRRFSVSSSLRRLFSHSSSLTRRLSCCSCIRANASSLA